jgi:hypothetical protein
VTTHTTPRDAHPHYHQDGDLPEFVDTGCVDDAARLAKALVRDLAAGT